MRIRVGLVGCGGIGAGGHARAYAANSDVCDLVACADLRAEAADALADKYGCQSYSDVASMLDTVKPDAISICTPPAGHLPVARLAAERGVAILCEKPLVRNMEEADEMVALVQRTGVPFMTAFCAATGDANGTASTSSQVRPPKAN